MFKEETTANLAERKPLGDIVFDAICDEIVSGRIGAGTWLRQEEISDELGVSHTPVRQALERIIAEGLAERVPYKGVRVSKLSHENIAEIYALRMLLEPFVNRAAAIHLSDIELNRLSEINAQIELLTEQDQMSERRDLNRRFHMVINKACPNELLRRLYEIVLNKTPIWMTYEGMFRQSGRAQDRLKIDVNEHEALLNAFKARDPDLAESETLKCFDQTVLDIADLFKIPLELLKKKIQEVTPKRVKL
jgi:DNA-binding GntR family transcriptional regulator